MTLQEAIADQQRLAKLAITNSTKQYHSDLANWLMTLRQLEAEIYERKLTRCGYINFDNLITYIKECRGNSLWDLKIHDSCELGYNCCINDIIEFFGLEQEGKKSGNDSDKR